MGQLRTGSLESLRELNRLRVVDALRQRGAISRADIARRTGLSRSTVSSLVADLQADGLVVEREVATRRAAPRAAGRRCSSRSTSPPAPSVGIDFGHRHVRVAVADLSSPSSPRRSAELDVDHDAPTRRSTLAADLVDELLEEAGVDRERACSAPAWACRARSTASAASSARARSCPAGSASTPRSRCETRLELPVHVDNDANLGALAEAAFGAGRERDDLAYLMSRPASAPGLILDGRLYRGARGLAGEIGHVLVDPQGPICRCGNRGCLETFAVAAALCELLRRSHGDHDRARDLLGLAREGDAGCRRVIADAGRVVGRAVADLCNVINPELVVVGGDLAAAGDLLLDPMRESVRRFAIPAAAEDVRIVAGVLGDRAEVLGALALVGPRVRPTP